MDWPLRASGKRVLRSDCAGERVRMTTSPVLPLNVMTRFSDALSVIHIKT
jgi:hypothetical protein